MASYIEGALVKDERVVYIGHISLWSLAVPIGLGILLLVVGVGLIFLGYAYVKYKTTEVAITNRRVIVKFGFISRRTVELNIHKVETVQVDQSMLGRLFDFGTLVISGAGTVQEPIVGIAKPMAFRKAFMEAQDQSKGSA